MVYLQKDRGGAFADVQAPHLRDWQITNRRRRKECWVTKSHQCLLFTHLKGKWQGSGAAHDFGTSVHGKIEVLHLFFHYDTEKYAEVACVCSPDEMQTVSNVRDVSLLTVIVLGMCGNVLVWFCKHGCSSDKSFQWLSQACVKLASTACLNRKHSSAFSLSPLSIFITSFMVYWCIDVHDYKWCIQELGFSFLFHFSWVVSRSALYVSGTDADTRFFRIEDFHFLWDDIYNTCQVF